MTARWRKALRDLDRGRAVLAVLAIAVGLAAFYTVLSTYAILIRELDRGYLATAPASATIWTDEVDPNLVRDLAALADVADVEARRELAGRLKVAPMKWRDLTLIVAEDFRDIRISRFGPEEGVWPPRAGEIAIERDALQVAKAAIGDEVTISVRRGEATSLRVVGSVHDVGRAQARMENVVYGYVARETLASLGEAPTFDRIELLVGEPRYDEEHIRAVVADASSLLEARGRPVRRLEIPTPGKHPHAAIMGLLLLWMAAFGLFVLLLSAILVAALMASTMASQVRQIGIMKAVGGSRGQIAAIYGFQALVLGAVALLLGIPAGIWGGRTLCRYLAVLLNFDIESFAVPLWVWLLAILVGLATPLLAAAHPVWRWSRVPVLEALVDSRARLSDFGERAFDRLVGRIGGVARPILLAVRSTCRKPSQTLLSLLIFAVAGIFFLSALNIRASSIHTLDLLFGSRHYDLSLRLGEPTPLERLDRAASGVGGLDRTEGWITTEATLLDRPRADDAPDPSQGEEGLHGHSAETFGRRTFPLVALPRDSTLLEPRLVDGRGLASGDAESMVVNSALRARFPQLAVGDTIEVQVGASRASWRVIGIAREPFSPPVAYVPLETLDRLAGYAGKVDSFRIALASDDAGTAYRVQEDLEQAFQAAGIEAMAATSTADSRYGFDQHMLMIYVFLIIVSVLIALVGGLGLATTTSLAVLERRREMGVLRALGATPATICLMLVVEALVVAVASWGVAAIAAAPLSSALGDLVTRAMFGSDLDFRYEPLGLAVWLAVVLLIGAAAGFLPAWRASRAPVRQALEYE